jgi:dolichyl-phosphate-mannose-protein mannosyltransferase
MRNRLLFFVLVIILSSLLTHFLFFGHPNETVFDEVHFGKFISGYFTGEYFFDIHPPLGKLLISGAGYLAGFNPGFSFAEIGQKFPDNTYLWLRLLPILAGVLLPLIIFFLVLRLGLSRLAAFSAAMLVVLENALLVQSRFILLDSFLLLFGFSALLAYFKYAQENKTPYLLLSGALAALSLSVKWTGIAFLAIIIVLEIVKWLKNARSHNYQTIARPVFQKAVFLFIIPSLIYFSIFAIHLGLLTKSGPGDAFMTPAFQKTLSGNNYQNDPDIKPPGLLGKFKELNLEMYRANANLTAGHPYSSRWYTWPFMTRPIYYWNESSQNAAAGESRIYLLGNPVIWWASTIAMAYLLLETLLLVLKAARSKKWTIFRKPNRLHFFLAGSFILNILPFFGIKRAMFLYHYMTALVFAIIALVYLLDQMENKKKAFATLLIACLAAFIFFAPLTYGLPLSKGAYHARVWLHSWQ